MRAKIRRRSPDADTSDGDDDAGHREQHKLLFLVRSAASLASASIVTSGLGFIYWAAAARLFSASEVGESATAISAMNLIAPFAVLGFGTVLIVQLPTMKTGQLRLIFTTTLICGVVGAVLALACALALPTAFLGLPGIGSDLGVTALFVGVVATQGVGFLLDQALLSLIGGGPQLARNTIQAAGKLVLLVLFALALTQLGALSIISSWLLGNVVSIAVVAILLIRRYRVPFGILVRGLVPVWSHVRGLSWDAVKHHALNLAIAVPYFAIPIVANVTLGSEQAGYLFAAWSAAAFVFYLPMALATALFASGARNADSFLPEFRFTLRTAVAGTAAANVLVALLGGLVLEIFGHAYAENARVALIVMCLGGFGLVVKDHHVAVARTLGTVGREAVLISALTVVELAGAAAGAWHHGITGLSLGWFAAVGLNFVVCGPLVLRAYRGRIDVTNPEQAAESAAVAEAGQ